MIPAPQDPLDTWVRDRLGHLDSSPGEAVWAAVARRLPRPAVSVPARRWLAIGSLSLALVATAIGYLGVVRQPRMTQSQPAPQVAAVAPPAVQPSVLQALPPSKSRPASTGAVGTNTASTRPQGVVASPVAVLSGQPATDTVPDEQPTAQLATATDIDTRTVSTLAPAQAAPRHPDRGPSKAPRRRKHFYRPDLRNLGRSWDYQIGLHTTLLTRQVEVLGHRLTPGIASGLGGELILSQHLRLQAGLEVARVRGMIFTPRWPDTASMDAYFDALGVQGVSHVLSYRERSLFVRAPFMLKVFAPLRQSRVTPFVGVGGAGLIYTRFNPTWALQLDNGQMQVVQDWDAYVMRPPAWIGAWQVRAGAELPLGKRWSLQGALFYNRENKIVNHYGLEVSCWWNGGRTFWGTRRPW
ncbi:MAG: hypothetical protein OHK0039_02420 [Bacteroidia bacterium]